MSEIQLIVHENDEVAFSVTYNDIMLLDTVKPDDVIGQEFSLNLSLHYEPETGQGGSWRSSSIWCKVKSVEKSEDKATVKADYMGHHIEKPTRLTPVKLSTKSRKEILDHISTCMQCRKHLEWMF